MSLFISYILMTSTASAIDPAASAACTELNDLVTSQDKLLTKWRELKAPKLAGQRRTTLKQAKERVHIAQTLANSPNNQCSQAQDLLLIICSFNNHYLCEDEAPPRASKITTTIEVDLYTNERPGFSLAKINTTNPMAGDNMPITVNTTNLFGVRGWAKPPTDFSVPTALNTIIDGTQSVYLWAPIPPNGESYYWAAKRAVPAGAPPVAPPSPAGVVAVPGPTPAAPLTKATTGASSCSEDDLLTVDAYTAWSPPVKSGSIYRCRITPSNNELVFFSGTDSSLTPSTIGELTVTHRELSSVELIVTASNSHTAVYSASGSALTSGLVHLKPELQEGTVELKLRSIAKAGGDNIPTRSLGTVKATPEPPEVGAIQVHIGLLARDHVRNIVVAAQLTPVWSPKAHRAFLAGRSGWMKAMWPKPSVGVRFAADATEPIALTGGLAQPLVPGLHVIAGFELGTSSITETWTWHRASFLGITMSPAIYSKLFSSIQDRKQAK